MTGFAVMVRKEWREALASNRLLVVLIVFTLFGLISPVLAKETPQLVKSLGGVPGIQLPPPQLSDVVTQFIKNVASNGIFVVILITMGLVAREKERGTAAFVLVKPVTRLAFLAAKILTQSFVLAAGIALAALVAFWYTIPLFNASLAGGFWVAALVIWLYLLVITSWTFLGSALLASQIGAAGFGLAAFIGMSLLGILPNANRYLPSGLLDAARLLALAQSPQHLALTLAVNCGWIAIPLILSILVFGRQELVARQ